MELSSQTALIPLYGRANSDWHPSFRDNEAKRVHEILSKRYTIDVNSRQKIASVVRADLIDQLLNDVLSSSPVSTIVNLGAGFCTRHKRIRSKALWIHVDHPEILALRKELFLEEETLWTLDDFYKCLHELSPNKNVVIIAEGFFHYLPYAELVKLIVSFDHFKSSNLIFDSYPKLNSRKLKLDKQQLDITFPSFDKILDDHHWTTRETKNGVMEMGKHSIFSKIFSLLPRSERYFSCISLQKTTP